MSGVYELEPLRHTYVNRALGLDRDAAAGNSPVYWPPERPPPVIIARGGRETREFIRRHETRAALLRHRTTVIEVVSADRDHFDLPYELGDPETERGAAVLRQMGLAHTTDGARSPAGRSGS